MGVYVGDQENQGVNQNEIKEIMMGIYRNIDFKGKIKIIIELKNLNEMVKTVIMFWINVEIKKIIKILIELYKSHENKCYISGFRKN